jgi:hypothetical protein
VVSAGQTFIQSWEDLSFDMWGPRTGNDLPHVVPAILDAPGAVVLTSNKRDVVDGTRGVRVAAALVWVFDPQKIDQKEPDWWWTPLSDIIQCLKSRNTLRWVAPTGSASVATDARRQFTLASSPPSKRRSTSSPKTGPAPPPLAPPR